MVVDRYAQVSFSSKDGPVLCRPHKRQNAVVGYVGHNSVLNMVALKMLVDEEVVSVPWS